jgi:ATP-dependent helicase/nuclease subunit B
LVGAAAVARRLPFIDTPRTPVHPGWRARLGQIRLVLGHDPLRLLELAADGFLTPCPGTRDEPFPSPPYLLALRQGGLRDDLIALAAERGVPGWFDPPLCIFHELPNWLGGTGRTPCDDFERAVILGGVLRGLGGEVFGRMHRAEDFIGAVDRLFGELIAEGVRPEEFHAALEAGSQRDGFERQRDSELAMAYAEYDAALAAKGRRDGRDTWLDCARAIAVDPDGLAARLGGRGEIRLFGLQDLRGGWRGLLRGLAEAPGVGRVVIYSWGELELGDGIDVEITRVEERRSGGDSRAGAPADAPAARAMQPHATVQVISGPDVERELELVAARVRALADAGTPLARIAVVARQARPYVDLALAALDKAGVPATARRRIALCEVPVVRALRALLAAAADGWSRHGLVELAEQPYAATELDARILNFAGFRRRVRGLSGWRRALDELAAEAQRDDEWRRGGEEPDDHRKPLPPLLRCEQAATRFAGFAARAATLDGSRTLREWLAWLEDFLTADAWKIRDRIYQVPARRFEIVRVDLNGWQGLADIVRGWRAALAEWGGADAPIDVAEFHRQFSDLLEGDVALWTETQRGVQVLEGLAAAYRSFDHVFLVGLEAGRFPLPASVSPILDERERQALREAGLPLELRATWDARERELFGVLVAGARRLTVSYARLDASGREVVRSAFVDELGDVCRLVGAGEAEEIPASCVSIPGIRLYAADELREQAVHAARIEWHRRSGEPSPWNGLIEDPALVAHLAQEFGDDRLWSPTQLESYAKCPWSYFSARLLGLDRLADPDEEMDAATRGSVLHDALRRFYSAAQVRTGGPVFFRTPDLAWAHPTMVEALDQALADARGHQWLGNGLLLPAKREELRRMLERFLEWEVQEHEDMENPKKKNAPRMVRTAVTGHEVAFNDIVLDRGGVRFRFRGSVDRVEIGVDERLADPGRFIAAVDYKTTKYAVPGAGAKEAWSDGVVLQVPLYAYALAQVRPGTETARVEYRALKKPESVHALELYQFDKNARGAVHNEAAAELMEAALDQVAGHVLRARRGEFPASPPESCGCPEFCHAIEICRTAGGPRRNGWK